MNKRNTTILAVLVTTALVFIGAQAQVKAQSWSWWTNLGAKEIETTTFSLETKGYNPRAYLFELEDEKVCLYIASDSGSGGLDCWDK